jgi:hypothetical protein
MRSLAYRVLPVFVALLLGTAAGAAPTPVKIEIPIIRPIQTYTLAKEGGGDAEDEIFLLTSGVAQGQEFTKRIPEQGTVKTAPKTPAFEGKPATIWEGTLNDGEFAYVTVVLMQGSGKDHAKLKEFQGKLDAAAKTVAERSKKTATTQDTDKVIEQTLKAQREVIAKVKDTFSREKNTDHYGGLFNLMVWNNGGKITKRLDPVGLTFGEHKGVDAKIYSKIKLTRTNVLEKAKDGGWNEVQFNPIDDDKPEVVRVKMLENEYVKQGDQSIKKTIDYLADVKVTAGGKVQTWELGEEQHGETALQTYWDYAQ